MYSLFVFAVYKYSKSNKNYMIFDGEILIINYPNFQAKISIENIIEIEYYKISSFKAWCMIFNYVAPQCSYVKYVDEKDTVCKLIGYPDFNKIRNLCIEKNIKFLVK